MTCRAKPLAERDEEGVIERDLSLSLPRAESSSYSKDSRYLQSHKKSIARQFLLPTTFHFRLSNGHLT